MSRILGKGRRAGLVSIAVALLSCSSSAPLVTTSTIDPGEVLAPGDATPAIALVRHQSAAPMTLTASDGTGLELVSVNARSVVEGRVAFTEIALRFHNPEPRVREGRFRIALPEGAMVNRFAMRIRGRFQEGEVVRKQRARQTYEDFLHRKQDPALLEQGAGNEFSARVFPIAANEEKELIVSYTQLLDGESASLALFSGLGQVEQFRAAVHVHGQDRPVLSLDESAYQPVSDLAVPIQSDATLRSGDRVVTWVEPVGPTPTTPIESALILVDTSASSAFDLPAQVEQLARLVARITADEGVAVPITVAAFDQDVDVLYRGSALDFGRDAMQRLLARQAMGASNLEGALRWAKRELGDHPRKRLVVLSDGVATAGQTDGAALRAAARELTSVQVDRIDAIAFGGLRDSELLASLVTAGLNHDGVVLSGEAPAVELANKLRRATLRDVPIEVEGASFFYPRSVSGIQPGDRIPVVATLPAGRPVVVRASGKALPIGPERAATAFLVDQAWARGKMDSLLDREREQGRTPQLAERIADLSVEHRILSPYTALLVLETEADYARYDIDRTALTDIFGIEGDRIVPVTRASSEHDPDTLADPLTGAIARAGTDDPALQTDRDVPWGDAGNGDSGLWGDAIGESFGAGGLGLSGIGEGGGGRGEGIALGPVGTIGHGAGSGSGQGFGSGSGRLGGSHAPRPPQVRMGSTEVSGRIPPEIIQRVVRTHFGAVRACYEQALQRNPGAAGRMSLRFVIQKDGSVGSLAVTDDSIEDAQLSQCMRQVASQWTFPKPDGVVTVTYPFVFQPSEGQAGTGIAAAPTPPPAPELPEADAYDGDFARIMDHIARGEADTALSIASGWRASAPTDVLALVGLGEALEATGHKSFAARAYGSIIDLYPDRADLRRYAGSRLERVGTAQANTLALDTYAKALEDRPDHPSSHRFAAFAHLRSGDAGSAFATLEGALKEDSRVGNFPGVERILREDLGLVAAAWMHKQPSKAGAIAARLDKAGAELEDEASMRFVLTWETDANDVDLHVYDDRDGHAFFSAKDLPSGGTLYEDVTRGYGPECFTVRASDRGDRPAGEYTLFAHYYARGPMGYGMGKVEVIRHDGNGRLAFEQIPYVVMKDRAYVRIGTVKGL